MNLDSKIITTNVNTRNITYKYNPLTLDNKELIEHSYTFTRLQSYRTDISLSNKDAFYYNG